MDFNTIIQVLDSTVRLSTPLLLACLAGLFSERSGIVDIGLEGKMLIAAFFSAAVAYMAVTNETWTLHLPFTDATIDMTWMRGLLPPVGWGLLAGIASAMVLSGIHGLASITFRGNQIISGVALNFLASGLTVLIAQTWFSQGGRTPSLIGNGRFEELHLPFADQLRDVAVIGPIYSDLISGHSILVYVAFLMVPLTWWILFRTRFGLRLRAVGEAPEAVDTAGVSVTGLRFASIAIAGVLCGLAGAYLATGLQAGFVREMTAGRGYIALAALIFAKWRPWYALGACLLFGFLQAVALRFQNIDLGAFTVPVQVMDALPYILTVVILAGFVGKAIPPRAGGEPYVKER
ncbi:ABC transporter permease [Mameliella sediminis]|uniref:ABC transporter permease n=1 Tax=Mameliella sediminis TaxID=2836866 RepID=UPI001C4553D1|nr:ABC transporter permease [Mameliella sediminis]MBY6115135.1 ABC transporter permease [Antarctobacter heliothermus]MBY6144980.1 ABC transporter permease [Mameliella alba]MBV7396087.1 ABC transporter permease [Mameliella sediminis]MBY6160498.1 ABC transporter permease [Mameliella alba]MBY6168968.1 ABC transporter permease [Mameliella alba]